MYFYLWEYVLNVLGRLIFRFLVFFNKNDLQSKWLEIFFDTIFENPHQRYAYVPRMLSGYLNVGIAVLALRQPNEKVAEQSLLRFTCISNSESLKRISWWYGQTYRQHIYQIIWQRQTRLPSKVIINAIYDGELIFNLWVHRILVRIIQNRMVCDWLCDHCDFRRFADSF